MPAKAIAAMGRSYKCLQADRQDCLQLAARQRGVWTTGISRRALQQIIGMAETEKPP